MRIRMNDSRKRMYETLQDATGESSKSGSLDVAARYYARMRGDTAANPTGTITELMNAAEERGSLTPQEIAEILDCPELPVEYETSRSIGRADE